MKPKRRSTATSKVQPPALTVCLGSGVTATEVSRTLRVKGEVKRVTVASLGFLTASSIFLARASAAFFLPSRRLVLVSGPSYCSASLWTLSAAA